MRFYNVMKSEVFFRFFEKKCTFRNTCFKFCEFLSRKAMRMIDTALESLDLLFFADRILGTTGVPYVSVIFHLWVRVNCLIQQFD